MEKLTILLFRVSDFVNFLLIQLPSFLPYFFSLRRLTGGRKHETTTSTKERKKKRRQRLSCLPFSPPFPLLPALSNNGSSVLNDTDRVPSYRTFNPKPVVGPRQKNPNPEPGNMLTRQENLNSERGQPGRQADRQAAFAPAYGPIVEVWWSSVWSKTQRKKWCSIQTQSMQVDPRKASIQPRASLGQLFPNRCRVVHLPLVFTFPLSFPPLKLHRRKGE